MDFDRSGLIQLIRSEFKLDWHGVHGANHWARVFHHGNNIGQLRNVDLLVVELFGFLHDSCRLNDGRDPLHGQRAAEFAHGIHGDFYSLHPKKLDQLCFALKHHSGGDISIDATIQTCWDSDRLDLGRVGIIPSPRYLSDEASIFIDLAYDWSIR
ncbi:hypothetical protein VC178_08190 [Polynucleobacter sp. AP-Sanab-80-C2]|uniref:hypothetical protein n=1 Tax=Polynucleobacter sp. AP-Sanab-80-C2 TaxID=3108274 RepID=UPI002B22AD12|nr:hypothetical protein [Polynucleobacter sp. AP-Sanab-80-C2]MEA9599865.1 hypothetical protein [Polynucleobacter sp. AP-Sanab-80-C2]